MKQHLMDIWRRRFPEPLIAAFDSVPRELFVLPANAHDAYGDFPLPILYGQTISQPSTVMLMINALALCLDDKVLEVGAGSGYCAAIMSRLCREVVATDIISGLVVYARQNLKKAGVTNVKVLHADGSQGYLRDAPYDKIIVSAACPAVPEPLIAQLSEGGILVAPVGSMERQQMVRLVKSSSGIAQEQFGDFAFVPLKGAYGMA